MLVLTVPQLIDASEGSVPEAFRGKIKKVWPQTKYVKKNVRQGESPDGTLQKIILTEGASEIEIMLEGRGEVSRTTEGSSLFAIAANGARGLSGMKRKSNTYNGKTSPQVWIYDSAEVTFEGANGNGAGHSAPRPETQQNNRPAPAPAANGHSHTNGRAPTSAPAPQSPAPHQKTPTTPAERAGAIKEYNLRLARATSAYERCFDAAAGMVRRLDDRLKDIGGFKPSADTVEKMAACLMVQACWTQKPADILAFPTRDFSAYDEHGNLKVNGGQPPPIDPAAQRGGQGAPFNA